ncbi:MAG TPA: DUF1275 family protein, partial [Acidimicrobiales bacterium]|nr:DUF1275 family protein [Acidimicrobiales bacterium]
MRTEGPGWLRPLIHDKRDGPLPALLLGLTVLTGLVDAVSILSLGRVFVANMTGNVVFIGFALAGAPGFSLAASVSALGGFLAGAGLGGRLAFRFGHDRGRLLFVATSVELVCVGVGLLIVGLEANPLPGVARDGAAAVVAVALGAQNAAVRALAIPDLTTTVLTMTLTGLAADVRAGLGPAVIRRFLAVVTMFGGAAIGALLDLKVSPAAALGAAVAVLFAVTVATVASTRRGQLLDRA